MSEFRPTYLTGAALITCVVEQGRGDDVIRAAHEVGAAGAIVHQAHGVGVRERLGILAIALEAEKETVTFLVAEDLEELTIQHVYTAAGLDRPGAGMIHAVRLDRVATYVSEDARRRLEAAQP